MSEDRAARWTSGYTQDELDAAQERFDLRFPPDLVALFRERRPLEGYDWRKDFEAIRDALRAPLEGLIFDVESNYLWWPEWGERPASSELREEIVASAVRAAPRLIPLIGHRYLPATPHRAGNPVFSIVQSDVIYYGSDLTDYFAREFAPSPRYAPVDSNIRQIPFWSTLVDRNGEVVE